MQVRVSPELLALLCSDETNEQREVLERLWRETQEQIKQHRQRSLVKQREVRVPKKARYAFD